ncbi:Fc receptor-like protein 5 [Megalops cyprinoides]|uniref:Fc receptor-like protein 5 n=1 Tax=Megalops cyprinoides TaxID=118141 RepID=UPI001863F270|nr:Fc receptor-like protein 5 [Megalops cyprinoides]
MKYCEALPRASLTVEPQWHPLYTGERITLKCEVDSHSNWTYFWYKDQLQTAIFQTVGHSVTGDTYTITAAAVSDQGQYWCEGQLEGRNVTSQRSDPVTPTVRESPKPTLILHPDWPQIFTGETITLRCQGEKGRRQGYSWYKGRRVVHRSPSSREDTYTITSATEDHSGSYYCYGSAWSNAVTLSISEKPQPVLTVSPHEQVYEGESVTLSCQVTVPSAGWKYYWYKNGSHFFVYSASGAKGSYTFRPAALTHSGQYRCRAGRGSPGWRTEYSNPVQIQVSALPRATLSVEPRWQPLYTGETVTLKCEVDSCNDWTFYWYRDWVQSAVFQTGGKTVNGGSYTITSKIYTQRQYYCEARLEGRNVRSQRSAPITLTVEALPRATLSVEPRWQPLYTGETVTLKCRVDSYNDWTFYWYRDWVQSAVFQTGGKTVNGGSYTITSDTLYTQRQYYCEARLEGRNVTSQRSAPITLTVEAKPQPVLTVSPHEQVYEGESVTLSCQVAVPSAGWRYYWYKSGSSSQLPATSGAKGSYTLSPAALTHTGQYRCRAGRGNPGWRTEYSKPVQIQVSAKPQPVLTVSPHEHIYERESVTLSCQVAVPSAGWRYYWYKSGSSSQLPAASGAKGSYTFSPAALTHTGQYRCRAGRGNPGWRTEYSNPVQIQVSAMPRANLTVEPQWRPLYYTGETITLKCEVDSYNSWTYWWDTVVGEVTTTFILSHILGLIEALSGGRRIRTVQRANGDLGAVLGGARVASGCLRGSC